MDRNPVAFNLMLDFIRNSGELSEVMESNEKMLKLELKFWAIDETFFQERPKNKFEIIQDLIDGHSLDLYDDANGQEFFQEQLRRMTNVNFKKMFDQGMLKIKNDFKINEIQEIVQIENGSGG